MINDQNIDQLFRDKLYNRDFEFNPAHWESAEKMIAAQEKKESYWFGGKMKIAIISALVILSGIGGYFILNNSTENELPIQENTTLKNENTEENSPIINSDSENVNAPNSNQVEEVKSARQEVENTNVAENKEAEQKSGKKNTMAKENSAKNKNVSENEKNADTVKSGTEQMKIASQKSDSGSEKIEYEPEIFKMDKAVITVNDDKKLPFRPLKSKKGKSKKGPNSDDSTSEEELLNENKNQKIDQEKNLQNLLAEKIEFMPLRKGILPTKINNLAKFEQPETEQQQITFPLKDRLNWLRHISMGILVGENVSSDLKNTSNTLGGISIRPIGGVRVAYQLNEQVDLETGLFYNYRGGLNSKITTSVSTDANNINRFSISKTLSLHYLDLPLHFTYKHGLHSFIVGMQYSHLINTYEQTINTIEENGYSSVESSTKQWNANDGRFSNCDLAVSLGYEYEITERILFSARYNRGFFDVTDNSSFGNSVSDINKQFRIMLDYRFLKY